MVSNIAPPIPPPPPPPVIKILDQPLIVALSTTA